MTEKKNESATAAPRGVFRSLIPGIRKALNDEGYVTPTEIQTSCIPSLVSGRDMIGIAQTGTGKTAAYALPCLQSLAKDSRRTGPGRPRVLVLAPTRELADQIALSFRTYGRYLAPRTAVVYGGVKQGAQVTALRRGPAVLVATPGRLLDLMGQGYVDLSGVEKLILDEFDRMLDMGFIVDIRRILSRVPERRQTMLFSATMAGKMKSIAEGLLKDPVMVRIKSEKPAVESIDQKVFYVSKYDKDDLLLDILSDPSVTRAIVFTQMKHTANKVARRLQKDGIKGTAIHGNKSQNARTSALEGFRTSRFEVLVATDVAARGLDVDSITHVINYDLPVEPETYVHRIGRTARAGSAGDAISLCTREDRGNLAQIEKLLGSPVPVDDEHRWHSALVMNSVIIPGQKPGGRFRRRR